MILITLILPALTFAERIVVHIVIVLASFIAGMLIRSSFDDWFNRRYVLRSSLRKVSDPESLVAYEELDIEPDGIIQPKGVTIKEIADIKDIMRGKGKSNISDLDSAIIIAKMQNTILFDKLQGHIIGAKQNISSLIDRIERKSQSENSYKNNDEEYFYEQTGFSIKDFLPRKSG